MLVCYLYNYVQSCTATSNTMAHALSPRVIITAGRLRLQEKLADKSEEERIAYWEERQRLKAVLFRNH